MNITEKIQKTIRHNFLPQNIGHTIVEMIAVFVWMGSTMVLYLVLGSSLPEIGFLNSGSIISIIATYFMSDGLMYAFLYRNIQGLGQEIESGKIENYLLLPVNSTKYIGFRNIQFASMIQIPIALILLLIFGNYTVVSVLFWILSLGIGFYMTFNIWFGLSLFSFWFKLGDQASVMYEEIIQMSMFPIQIFLGARIFLPLLPIAFVASGGSAILADGAYWIVLVQLALLIVLVWIRKSLWSAGLKRFRQ